MLKEAEEQRLEVLAAAGRYVSYNMCVCSYNCVCRFSSSTIGLPPLYNCTIVCSSEHFLITCVQRSMCAEFILTNGLPPCYLWAPVSPLLWRQKGSMITKIFCVQFLFPFDLLMIPWDWFFTSQLNSWTDIPSAGEGGGGPAEGSDPLQGRRDDVRGSQVRQGHRHLLDHLQGRVGHHPQRGVHAGVQGGTQSHCHSTHSSF